jgi:hypothetical protein
MDMVVTVVGEEDRPLGRAVGMSPCTANRTR